MLAATSHDEAAWLMARSLFRFLGLRVAIMDNQMEKKHELETCFFRV